MKHEERKQSLDFFHQISSKSILLRTYYCRIREKKFKNQGNSFLRTSEENLSTLKRNNGTKQGGRGRRRG